MLAEAVYVETSLLGDDYLLDDLTKTLRVREGATPMGVDGLGEAGDS
jgi:hypothetical protein